MYIEHNCIVGDKISGTVATVPERFAGCLTKVPVKNVIISNNDIVADIDYDSMPLFESFKLKNRNIFKNKISS